MAYEVEFQDAELKKFLSKLSEKLQQVKDGERKYTALLSSVVFRDIIQHFEQEQGSEGKWQEWSASYRQHMEEIGKSGNKILQFTGKLRNNFKPQNVKRVREGLMWFNDAKTKTGFPYAFAHNEGGSVLPKRDFMWLSDKAIDDIEKNTIAFMNEKES